MTKSRVVLARTLTYRWVRVHRPDVWEAVLEEVNRQIPLKRKGRPVEKLPTKLQNFK